SADDCAPLVGGGARARAASVGCGLVCADTAAAASTPASDIAAAPAPILFVLMRGFGTEPLSVARVDFTHKIDHRVISLPVLIAVAHFGQLLLAGPPHELL